MRQKLLFVIIGMIILAEIGLLLFLKFQFPKPEEKAKPEVKEKETQTAEEITEILVQAARRRDPSLCEELEGEERKKGCQYQVFIVKAIDERDIKWCQKIEEDQTARMNCLDNVISAQAVDAKDPILCDKIQDEARMEICKKKIASFK